MNSLLITIDDRERDTGLMAALRAVEGVEVQVRRLKVGDIEAGDLLLFERKTPADFAASIADGRLFAQAGRLRGSNRRVALVIEGRTADWTGLKVPRPGLLGAMVSLGLVFGLPILRSASPTETARIVLYAARQVAALSDRVFLPRGNRPRGRRRAQLLLLQRLPGVGAERAGRLLDHLGTIEGVVTATEKELRAVPGIGKTTARAIRGLVT